MPKTLEGYIGDQYGQPIEGVPATVTRVIDGAPVAFGASQPDGRWVFSDLDEAQEHFVTLLDAAGRAAVRGPWSGELREAWVRNRLAAPLNTTVNGQPLKLDSTLGNSLTWTSAGLFVPPVPPPLDAYLKTEADARFVNVAGDTMTGRLNINVEGSSHVLRITNAPFDQSNNTIRITSKGYTGTLLAPTQNYDLDNIFSVEAYGQTATVVEKMNFLMRLTVWGTVTAAATPTKLSFWLMDSAGVLNQRLTIDPAGALTAAAFGHLLGALGPTAYYGAMPDTDASIMFYRNSATNWAGVGVDGSGNFWLRTGLSGSPVPALTIDSAGVVDVRRSIFRAMADLQTWRAGAPTQGILYLGNSGANYLLFDGSANFSLVGGHLNLSTTRSFIFPNEVKDDKLILFSGYTLGIRGGTMGYFVPISSAFRWYVAGVEGMSLTSTQLITQFGHTIAGDVLTYRAGAPTTGYVFLNSTQTAYLGFDGTSYQAYNAPMYVKGRQVVTTTNVNAKFISIQGWAGNGGVQTVAMGVGTHAYMAFVMRVPAPVQFWVMCCWPGVGNVVLFLNQGATPAYLNVGYCNVGQSYLYLNMGGEVSCPNANGVYYLGLFIGSSDAATY